MPEDYDLDTSLYDDGLLAMPFLAQLQKNVPKLASGALTTKPEGTLSLFVSNDMEDLRSVSRNQGERLNEYYRRCIPLGNIKEYRSLEKMTQAERMIGQISLCEERSPLENYMQPVYTLRDEADNPYQKIGTI